MGNDIDGKIVDTFPIIEEIQHSELRGKVIKAWARALKEGSFKNMEDIPFSVAIPEKPSSIKKKETSMLNLILGKNLYMVFGEPM